MRILRFIVNDQIIEKDPSCSFENLVPGSDKYIKAKFTFSPAWDGFTKVVSFRSMLGNEFEPQFLQDGTTCLIPAEALKRRAFKIQVLGQKGPTTVTTNKLVVEQKGGA
jgi:hypothetical protein